MYTYMYTYVYLFVFININNNNKQQFNDLAAVVSIKVTGAFARKYEIGISLLRDDERGHIGHCFTQNH